jgi:multidrug efflux pump subunit AcrB
MLQRPQGALDNIYLNSPSTGEAVPLSTFVKWTREPTNFLSINHRSMYPSVTLSFNLAPGAAIQNAEAHIGAPATLIGNFQGNARAFQALLGSEPYLVAAAIIVIYIILGVLYESYVHPLTILSTLPSAGLGALVTLMLFGYDFGLIVLIGIILLIGIVKKNGIMLVDFAIEAQRSRGLAPASTIREACLLRSRPIMMTTMAPLLGGIPLMLRAGTGAEIRQPLGYAIVGGLILSQALTLYTTPIVFLSGLPKSALGQTEKDRHRRSTAGQPLTTEVFTERPSQPITANAQSRCAPARCAGQEARRR